MMPFFIFCKRFKAINCWVVAKAKSKNMVHSLPALTMGFFVRALVIYVETYELFYPLTSRQLKVPKLLIIEKKLVFYGRKRNSYYISSINFSLSSVAYQFEK